jgi:hypothetical protein
VLKEQLLNTGRVMQRATARLFFIWPRAAMLSVVLAAVTASPAVGAGAGSFSPAGSLPDHVGLGSATASLPDGRILMAGGEILGGITGDTSIADSALFTPGRGFAIGPSLLDSRVAAAAAPMYGGRVLVAGGFESNSGPGTILASTEIFDPATNSFTAGPSLNTPRTGVVAAPLPGGGVLVAGGGGNPRPLETPLASAEVLPPGSSSFVPVGSMSTPRIAATASPLPDGRVLVVGDVSGPSQYTTEIFDPAPNTFSPGPTAPFSMSGISAAPLPDGRVLLAGGIGAASRRAVVLDPSSGIFTQDHIGQLRVDRERPALAPLRDGRVLVAGGDYSNTSGPHTSEIYAAKNNFKVRVSGRTLIAHVLASGTVRVRGLGLRRSHASGGPGRIKVRLRLTARLRRILTGAGSVRVRARIRFKPLGGLPRTKVQSIRLG